MSSTPAAATRRGRAQESTAAQVWAALERPTTLSRIVFLVGFVSVVSAVLPGIKERTELVNQMVPGTFPAAATTGAAAVGVVLVLLSRGLRRGKRRAWLLAVVLSGLAALLHLLKGLDVEEAALCVAVLALLLRARHRFTARPDPRSLQRLAVVVFVGPFVATALGYLWLGVDADGQAPGTTVLDRVVQAAAGLVGVPGPVKFVDSGDAARSAVALAVLGAAVLVVALLVALQPASGPHPLTTEERERVRCVLDRWGQVDSLSYFSLREDRAALFSPSGKAAVTYRVVGTVSLGAGDPLGDPEAWPGAIDAWLAEARSYGWTPAVLGTSERGAEAYHRAGLEVLELGDEAVLQTADFTLEGRHMRIVRQAVSRCDRAGIVVTCHRVADVDPSVLEAARHSAVSWREGQVERGFSMALGRLGDPVDDRNVLVLARDASQELVGVLSFVPWGTDGLSLDVMRRDRGGENGVVEAMVAQLMQDAPGLGVVRVSLNFAVFRSVFARGERLGAGPALRAWRAVLLWASRFWQIESLYRANAKYRPEWVPRYIAYPSTSCLPRVATAALRAEAFLVAPAWLRRIVKP